MKKQGYNWTNCILHSTRLKYCAFCYFICIFMRHKNISISKLLSLNKILFMRMKNGLVRALLYVHWTWWLKQGTDHFQITAVSEMFYRASYERQKFYSLTCWYSQVVPVAQAVEWIKGMWRLWSSISHCILGTSSLCAVQDLGAGSFDLLNSFCLCPYASFQVLLLCILFPQLSFCVGLVCAWTRFEHSSESDCFTSVNLFLFYYVGILFLLSKAAQQVQQLPVVKNMPD